MALLYKVRYTFRAEDDGELSVTKGDLVKLVVPSSMSSSDHASLSAEILSKDGWTLVETLASPAQKGYVPTNYIIKNPGSEPAAKSAPHQQVSSSQHQSRPRTGGSDRGITSERSNRMGSPRESSPTRTSRIGPIRRLSDPRLPQHLLETLEATDATIDFQNPAFYRGDQAPEPSPARANEASHHQLQPFRQPSPGQQLSTSLGGDAVDLTRIFADHDALYEKVIREREEEFDAIETSLNQVHHALAEAQGRNEDVVAKAHDIEAQVEALKRQLNLQIEEDRKSLSERVSKFYNNES
mmetsp:Transcript_13548/g.26136  ORF Transcript_13548/g.26136 Transcript_13548/m.26136 type:complete len:297 (+) Transcript_13548:166-1056(+)|eukprot:CAMPEP_0171511336 /NCGR_PEP_ID=MMETSP0959-20130129/933_1 /TAXON_ID=87120 /ORGANISM="Aurantiochytrium limacinum, Strain ATCCMYA-1381" /LENGTH=296 /DNA_ID=CAMNT_0012048941 /DNA_START=92 /DNA_END=982 /DNA_ORIENTATION=-